MRIRIIGGGPAGLYFALLMKKADPSHDIVIYERNRSDDTFGFGVVFSDETLGNFRLHDPESFRSITDAFAYWDEIDVHFDGEVIRSGGHGFCGLARKDLLLILQRRAIALGVDIRFETELDDIEALDGDLIVGADGINSLVREHYKDAFRPELDWRRNKFAWFGTTKPLKTFTFLFRANEHGLFQVHAYRYNREHSTWIVETSEETWRRAGLDRMTEAESLRYCEELFRDDLDNHPLLANRSVWRTFPTVKCARWVHENVALLGDAVHTAHFSIGSGTKLAMEGAIALFEACRDNTSVADALAAYERDRREEVERLQHAAQVSLEWFEHTPRYRGFEPLQFAVSLLTRSKRVTYENLGVRDPAFIQGVDRMVAARAARQSGCPVPLDPAPPPMFTPFRLRDMTLVNRVVVSPMCQYSAEDGMPNDWHLVHLGARATGGAGLVYTEMTDVLEDGRITPGCAGMWKDEHIAPWARIVDFVHANSRAKICMQLAHAGRKGSTCLPWAGGADMPLPGGNWPLIAPSELPYLPDVSQVPQAMDRDDMDRVRDGFVAAARRAEAAGFDMIELHMAHGYLLSAFISPLSNRRTDEYGGSLENRMRFPLEIFDAMRAAWPEAKPMSVRLSATDWVEGGLTGDDSVAIARLLKAHGCDIVDVSTGQTSPDARPVYGRMYQTPFADQIRQEAEIATMAVGNITSADQVNTIVAAGRADLVALARPHLANPHFTLAAAAHYGYGAQFWPPQYASARPQAEALADREREELAELREEAARGRRVQSRREAAE
ncbi:bifunctional salicylyl-CoA 5-hydroxylase/oxidoreductase [Oceanibacterium hippocampi]|uniref:NADPH dehydrogenase n=1 Tax=Oceanibacterium hippocampi TaxID=745714 RepID=A0A1Y5RUN1_9PROT|nr:bifunctional salicylyl-CoA 5-hydroxylase/oxidoreductase [Oceanibacterium hippocampi]SLN25892.1 NADPH dehydrogenase [Oceanibacterium hippocampi]